MLTWANKTIFNYYLFNIFYLQLIFSMLEVEQYKKYIFYIKQYIAHASSSEHTNSRGHVH